jgi:hypothetical protein
MTLSLLLVATLPGAAPAQQNPAALAADRQSYAQWLTTASTSPLSAVAMQRLTGPVTLGPDTSDIPLMGFGPATIAERNGAVTLAGPDGTLRPLPRGRPVHVAPWTFLVQGGAGNSVLTVYRTPVGAPPGWYAPIQTLAYSAALEPPTAHDRRRVLTLDGLEVEAELAGYVTVPLGQPATRLQVMRMPVPGTDETELQIYFRDLTSGRGSYPAGRFVEVTPVEGGRYRIDFNRARNPFCAYSSVYPCPVPWPGNSIAAAVEAGEKYLPARKGS